MMTDVVSEFIEQLQRVADCGAKLEALELQTTEGEANALELIISKIKPVMRYIDYPIEESEESYYHSGHQMHKEQVEYASERGIVAVDHFNRLYTDSDHRGEYTGHRLVITRSGKLIFQERDGYWSNWQNEPSCWNTTCWLEVGTKEAVSKYGLSDIIRGIVIDIREAIDKAEKKRKVLVSRLEAIKKVHELIS